MVRLSNFTQGRDNNFNLIRLAAAFAVLVSHSFALATGSGDSEPLVSSLGMSLGSVAADVFFVLSGFLVTGSLLSRQNAFEFIWARVLRIYPALVVMVLLSVFVLGLFFTSVPAVSFLESYKTRVFIFEDTTLIYNVAFTLPGVFESVPWKGAVNGSLWTMLYEVRLYGILVILWMVLGITGSFRLKMFKYLLLLIFAYLFFLHFDDYLVIHSESYFVHFSFLFFIGAAYYVLRERIILSYWFFAFAFVVLLASVIDKEVFFVTYSLLLAYILFFLAYVPAGRIRNFNRIGDYSYGVYIYAFPVQQSIAALVPGVSVIEMLVISTTVTFFMAALSWNLIEKRALMLKSLMKNNSLREWWMKYTA